MIILSLFFITSCHLSSLLIHKQTNNHCFLLSPGLPPVVLMSTGKWQNQPGNEEAHKETTFCSPSRRRVLHSFKMLAKTFTSAEVSIWEILEEFSHLANFVSGHKIRKTNCLSPVLQTNICWEDFFLEINATVNKIIDLIVLNCPSLNRSSWRHCFL